MILAVDIGGTKIAAARIRPEGTIDSQILEAPTPAAAGPPAVLDAVAELLHGLTTVEVTAIGVSSAGVIDSDHGVVLAATSSLARWAGTDVAEELRTQLNRPTYVLGDGHAFGVGEAVYGVGRGTTSLLLLAVGTGVGGSYIRHGQPLFGNHHVAGHFGHIAVPQAEGIPCPCGRTGHLEAVGGGAGILSWYRHNGGKRSVTSTRALFDRTGDPTASQAITVGAAAVGTGAASLANAFDPDLVVIAGGLAHAGPLWQKPVMAAFRESLLPALAELPLTFSEKGTSMALRGAAHYALRRHSP